eukprot:12958744-Heterocapsa_arctica.AAC.1
MPVTIGSPQTISHSGEVQEPNMKGKKYISEVDFILAAILHSCDVIAVEKAHDNKESEETIANPKTDIQKYTATAEQLDK